MFKKILILFTVIPLLFSFFMSLPAMAKSKAVKIGSDTTWVTVAAGYYHSLAIKADGTLWAWGDNYYGQLGDSTTTDRHSPVKIGSATTWVTVAAGLQSRQTAPCGHGEETITASLETAPLRNVTALFRSDTQRNSPVKIGSDTTWVTVAAGGYHSLAIKADGTLWAWGYNYYGQLGDGTTTQRNSPVQIGSDTTWVTVAAGYYHSLARRQHHYQQIQPC